MDRGGGAHFGSADTEAEMREVGLAEGHESRVEVAPDKEQEERDRGVILIAHGVGDGEKEIEAKADLSERIQPRFIPIGFFDKGIVPALNPVLRRPSKFDVDSENRFEN